MISVVKCSKIGPWCVDRTYIYNGSLPLIFIISVHLVNGNHSSLNKYLSPYIFSSYKSVISDICIVIAHVRFLFLPSKAKGKPGMKAPVTQNSEGFPSFHNRDDKWYVAGIWLPKWGSAVNIGFPDLVWFPWIAQLLLAPSTMWC